MVKIFLITLRLIAAFDDNLLYTSVKLNKVQYLRLTSEDLTKLFVIAISFSRCINRDIVVTLRNVDLAISIWKGFETLPERAKFNRSKP